MIQILVDENLPRSTETALKESGYESKDVRDLGLRGVNDEDIFEFAKKEGLTILTSDRGFGNIFRFPLGSHPGIIVANLPDEMKPEEMNDIIIRRLEELSEDDITGNVVILEQDKIRIRKK